MFGIIGTNSLIKDVGLVGVNVTGRNGVGGLVGYSGSGTIESSYSTGDVTGNSNVGGLVGRTVGGTIESSYSTGDVTGNSNVGGLVGGSGGKIKSSYYTGTVNGVALTRVSELSDFTSHKTYAITTVEDLANLATLVNSGKNTTNVTFIMGADLDLASFCEANMVDGVGGWTPIGSDDSHQFNGTFIGNGHTISNLTINRPDTNYQGLFGYIGENSLIKDVGLVGVNVTGRRFVCGLVGYSCGTIESSYSTGDVTGNICVGGLVGLTACGTIESSYSTGDVTGYSDVGGLVGHSAYATIESSYSAGDVTGNISVGGLVGMTVGGTIESSYSTGAANGEKIAKLYDSDGSETEAEIKETVLQVGINGGESNQIVFEMGVDGSLSISDISQTSAYDTINNFLSQLSTRATELGAVYNRLESAGESTLVSIDNLTSSRSTIKDADIAKVSSDYIKMQILQQASATLLATANQSPSIALQLI